MYANRKQILIFYKIESYNKDYIFALCAQIRRKQGRTTMKRLLLLATGGTIASVESKEGLVPGMTAEELLNYFEKSTLPPDSPI